MANPDIQKHLTTARRILMREAETFMPSGAAQQRAESLAVLDRFISGEKPQAVGTAYENLCAVFHDSSALGLASAIIEWIHSTHSFPDIPDQEIEDVSAALSMLLQRMMLRPEIKEWIAEAKGDRKLGADEKRNLALMEESWIMSAGLSEAFVNELSRAGSVSFRIWEKARPANDFTGWLKAWSEVVKLAQKKAGLLGKALDVSPYQAMLEQYNAGLHNETVNKNIR